jgi:hypothetical protein
MLEDGDYHLILYPGSRKLYILQLLTCYCLAEMIIYLGKA